VSSAVEGRPPGIDPAWETADPAALIPEHGARVAELAALDAELAPLYTRGAEALAGAQDEPALKSRHVVLLGRERGIITLELAKLPELPVEARKIRGRSLNLIKRWLGTVEEARRRALAVIRCPLGGCCAISLNVRAQGACALSHGTVGHILPNEQGRDLFG